MASGVSPLVLGGRRGPAGPWLLVSHGAQEESRPRETFGSGAEAGPGSRVKGYRLGCLWAPGGGKGSRSGPLGPHPRLQNRAPAGQWGVALNLLSSRVPWSQCQALQSLPVRTPGLPHRRRRPQVGEHETWGLKTVRGALGLFGESRTVEPMFGPPSFPSLFGVKFSGFCSAFCFFFSRGGSKGGGQNDSSGSG